MLLKASAIGLLYAYISAAPFILETHFGLKPAHFGVLFAFNSLFVIIGSVLVPKFKVIKHCLMVGGSMMCLGALAESVNLLLHGGIVGFEVCIIVMLFGSGMVFSTTNALSMEEGRADAGSAGAILNVVKYIFAAAVAPLVGIGNILHSSAVGFLSVTFFTIVLLVTTQRLKPLSEM